ncbi:MAG TPA: hypothetical protein DCY82_04625 [Acidimicrobiaceae bacterium]|nr:hypothetical protein [Acidimicrobiaceae bacterium]
MCEKRCVSAGSTARPSRSTTSATSRSSHRGNQRACGRRSTSSTSPSSPSWGSCPTLDFERSTSQRRTVLYPLYSAKREETRAKRLSGVLVALEGE